MNPIERLRRWREATRRRQADEEPEREAAKQLRQEVETAKWQGFEPNMPPRGKDEQW